MSRLIPSCTAIFLLAIHTASATADDGKVVITVEGPAPATKAAPFSGHRAAVDVAILLDTSNSMDGLIAQAKRQLWTIVEQFAKAKKQGQTPVLRVALFEYGNTRLPAAEGYIRQVVPLTDDLDKVSECLFALTTSGGDEYCGQVIDEAITRLAWSKEPGGYKAIFIAGNEPFTQGPIDYRAACKRAIENGIVVNTIHCGGSDEGINGKWRDGSQLAEGESFNIDQDRAVVQIKCPQDEIIIKLNAELNKTYLWYGTEKDRREYATNQAVQDANAEGVGAEVAAQRAVIKAGSAYSNSGRDLVDSYRADAKIVEKIPAAELPAEIKDLTPADRTKRVSEMAAKRAEVQAKINALAAERAAYLAKEEKRLAAEGGDPTLGSAVVATVQRQLAARGFEAEGAGK
jgi:hypothetical protein